jgi:hypothetical protein
VSDSWFINATGKSMVKDSFNSIKATVLEVITIALLWSIIVSCWERMSCCHVIYVCQIFYSHTFEKVVCFVNYRMVYCCILSPRENPNWNVLQVLERCNSVFIFVFLSITQQKSIVDHSNIWRCCTVPDSIFSWACKRSTCSYSSSLKEI